MSLENSSDAFQDKRTVKNSNHRSIRKIKNEFDLPYASTSDINEIIKSINVNKAKEPDDVFAKFFTMSAKLLVAI